MKVCVLLLTVCGCLAAWAAEAEARPDAALDAAPDTIVQSYWDATRGQELAFTGATMEVEIEGQLPQLKKSGRLRALRRISRLGRITYQVLGFEGDSTVKNQVIARYLSAEMETQKNQPPSVAVAPENYKFAYRGRGQLDGRAAYIFQVTPRHKRAGLFKGQLWIDAATYLRVQEVGYLVKPPSIFLKHIAFVRQYEIRDGMSVPRRTESTVDTRLVGKVELTIDYSNFSVGDASGEEDSQ